MPVNIHTGNIPAFNYFLWPAITKPDIPLANKSALIYGNYSLMPAIPVLKHYLQAKLRRYYKAFFLPFQLSEIALNRNGTVYEMGISTSRGKQFKLH
jgi:hypothetical protein